MIGEIEFHFAVGLQAFAHEPFDDCLGGRSRQLCEELLVPGDEFRWLGYSGVFVEGLLDRGQCCRVEGRDALREPSTMLSRLASGTARLTQPYRSAVSAS